MNDNNGTICWGIIGCGDVCEVKSGPAFSKVPHSKLMAVMRRDIDRAKDFAQRHEVPRYYADAAELVHDSSVNAVYIATPPTYREAYLEMALSAGKPVYVEKPVSVNAASVERMIALEKKYAGKVSVAHYRRGLPLFTKIKQLLRDGAIGKVKIILLKTLQAPVNKIISREKDNWRVNPAISGGGFFHDLSPHQLDILYWLFGAPQQVQAVTANQGKLYDAPDITMLQLAFDDDIYFDGIWNFNMPAAVTDDSCEIIGEKGRICFSFFRSGTIELHTDAGMEKFEMDVPVHIQQPHIANVVKFFRGEGINPCSLEEALVTMRIMDSAV